MMKLQHPANALRLKEALEAVQAARATLAAEVARLEAELDSETERLMDEAAMWQQTVTDLEAAVAALRAQLAAGEFIYDTDPPVDAQIDAICHEVTMDVRGTWWHGSNIIYPDGWRPAPPQE